jgi:hypothetical protein
VSLILALSHVGNRFAVGIFLLGIAFSWAFGSNSRIVHWLFVVSGTLLLFAAAVDAIAWPGFKAKLIGFQTSIIDSDTSAIQEENSTIENTKAHAGNLDLSTTLTMLDSEYKVLSESQRELQRIQAEGPFQRVMEVDWGFVVGGMLLLGAGLGLIIGVRPMHQDE